MAPALRCLVLAAGILGLAPGAASAATTVELNPAIGVLTITGDAAANDLTTLQTATNVDRHRDEPGRRRPVHRGRDERHVPAGRHADDRRRPRRR